MAISLFLHPSSVHGTAMTETRDLDLRTERLLLRPFQKTDAADLQRQAGTLSVARMTSRIPHPYPDGTAEQWIAAQDVLRRDCQELNFCIARDGAMIGSVGLRHGEGVSYALGYWIGEPHRRQGFATEAAKRAVAFAFADLAATHVSAGHYLDNPASARVLEKCGFRYTHTDTQWCVARGAAVTCKRYVFDARNGLT